MKKREILNILFHLIAVVLEQSPGAAITSREFLQRKLAKIGKELDS